MSLKAFYMIIFASLTASYRSYSADNNACPLLSQNDLAFYVFPYLGSHNKIPHKETTIIYNRDSQGALEGLSNFATASRKGVKGFFSKSSEVTSKDLLSDPQSHEKNVLDSERESESASNPQDQKMHQEEADGFEIVRQTKTADKKYIGKETMKIAGSFVCKYELITTIIKAGNNVVQKKIYYLSRPLDMPSNKEIYCPRLESTNIKTDQLKDDNGIRWKKYEPKASLPHLLNDKDLTQSPIISGISSGEFDKLASQPFHHKCLYTYHIGKGQDEKEKTLLINGAMSFDHFVKEAHKP